MSQCLKCWSRWKDQNRCSHPENHWLWIISAAFWCLRLLSRLFVHHEHLGRWLGYQLTIFQLLLGDGCFSWEVIWSFVHIPKVLWTPKVNITALGGGLSPLLLVLLTFFQVIILPFLRTAFVSFLNLFLYIKRNNFQENCEILLPFCLQYVCDLRSLKEKNYGWIWPASA